MTGAGRRAVAHVFVHDLEGPQLSDEDTHHLARVLRLRAGQVVSVSDGTGGVRHCAWAATGGLEPLGPVHRQQPASPRITVAFALTKGERPELAVQKLTEVGVDHIVLMESARCVARWGPGTAARHLQRLGLVARQAAMQSRRLFLPTVEGILPLARVTGSSPAGCALADMGGEHPDLQRPTILVGPEGGWSDEEKQAAPHRVSLGPHVLRAETAAIVAGALLVALRTGSVATARIS